MVSASKISIYHLQQYYCRTNQISSCCVSSVLKNRLVKKFSFTDLEKEEMVHLMPCLGDRKPSDLMDALLAVCPAGQQMPPLFINEFLCRIPGDIRRRLHTFSYRGHPCSCPSSRPYLVFPFQKLNCSYFN